MAIEIERRFLVFTPPAPGAIQPDEITQGYLATDDVAVRVRRKGAAAFLTVKGPKTGASAMEFEYPIPVDDFSALLALCGTRILTKNRYRLPGADGKIWELDIFTGRHAGLQIAELELPSENTPFARPAWLGPEITTDGRFSNARLSAAAMDSVHLWIAEYTARAL